jgi:uncharacterized protein
MHARTAKRGDWIQTYTGRRVYPLDPSPEDIDIADIAHALSNVCRFTGHVREFYSVAQHSVIVSECVPAPFALLGLMHDAPEAYIGDISRPLKKSLAALDDAGPSSGRLGTYEPIRFAEGRLMDAIAARFGFGPPSVGQEGYERREFDEAWQRVGAADVLLLATEARDLMGPLRPEWHHCEANGFPVLLAPIVPVPPAEAEAAFLARFHDLTGGRFR